MTGLSLTAKLHKILIQFRQGIYAVTADISKAFHRIIVDEDRKFLKFLWINLNSQEILTFQFKVVLFGATCSPYLLQETLHTHLSQNAEGNAFLDKFYVDNYMNSLRIMPCGVGHITKNSTNVFSACRKRRLKETGRGDWESPPL